MAIRDSVPAFPVSRGGTGPAGFPCKNANGVITPFGHNGAHAQDHGHDDPEHGVETQKLEEEEGTAFGHATRAGRTAVTNSATFSVA